MALRWNDIDQGNITQQTLAGRMLTVAVTSFTSGVGYADITIELYDGNRQPYQYVAGQEAVIDITVGSDTYVIPHPDYAFGNGIGAVEDGHGIGTAQAQYWAKDYRFQVRINAPTQPATTCYVNFNQGDGSTYYIRSAQRAWAIVIGA